MGAIERLEADWLARRGDRRLYRSIEITEAGVMLGAGTLLAPTRGGRIDLSGEDRILALVGTPFGRPVDPLFLAKLRRAADLWAQGE